ncbi:MAG TPA: hypothetical protein VGW40_15610 [Allosphingosinicella sp.]|nr:hypothetical protein [Allosphingosinicella sp.]
MSMPAPEAAPLWPLAGIAGFFLLAGAAIVAWPRPLIRCYIALLRPMRGLFGRLIDWEIGLLEGRAAPVVVRLFGAFVILAGASVIFYRVAGQ